MKDPSFKGRRIFRPQVEDDDHQLSVQHKNLPSKEEVNSAKATMLSRCFLHVVLYNVSWYILRWTYSNFLCPSTHESISICCCCQDINTLVDALIDEESTLLTRRRHREGLIQLLSRLYEVDVTAEAWWQCCEIPRDSGMQIPRTCWVMSFGASKTSFLTVSHSLRSILEEGTSWWVLSSVCRIGMALSGDKTPGQTSPMRLQDKFTQPPFSVVLIFLFCWKSHQKVSYEIIRIIQLDHVWHSKPSEI